MTAESREELISAYVDGELSAGERALVERWLAESPELRQLHEDLCALKSDVRSLERHKLDHDLGGSVLRKAEQAVLRGGAARPATITPPATIATWWNRGAGWRRIAWPVVAAAAALAILLFDANRRSDEQQVAQAPPPQAKVDEPTAELMPEVAAEAKPAAATDELEAGRQQKQGYFHSEMKREGGVPGAASPSPPPAAEPQTAAIRGARQAGMPSLGRIVQVSPEYLRSRSFEKLLDASQIRWQRIEPRDADANADGYLYAQRDLKKLNVPEQTAKIATAQTTYVLEADEQKVEKLLRNLERRRELGAAESDLQSRNAAVEPLDRKPAERADGAPTVTITLVASPQPAAEPPTAQPSRSR
jgi:hypothetical protein